MEKYLEKTKLLDYSNKQIQKLIENRNWKELETTDKLKAVYNFVRDEIKFGYNTNDDIPASEVLKDGFGQCNTKGTLLMALLRALNVPSRVHGSTVDKALQKGAISGLWYILAPKNIVHSWVEVYINEKWYSLEGVVIDTKYLNQLQKNNIECKTTFCGYGVYTDNFENPPIEWDFNNTYIQSKGVNNDFGIFDNPDEFYPKHKQQLGYIKNFIFKNIVRHFMNRNVNRIREKK